MKMKCNSCGFMVSKDLFISGKEDNLCEPCVESLLLGGSQRNVPFEDENWDIQRGCYKHEIK